MKQKKRIDPNSPEGIASIRESIRSMTREELIELLDYRTPGVEETDMTGMFGLYAKHENNSGKTSESAKP